LARTHLPSIAWVDQCPRRHESARSGKRTVEPDGKEGVTGDGLGVIQGIEEGAAVLSESSALLIFRKGEHT
jgi:hypothetical protein